MGIEETIFFVFLFLIVVVPILGVTARLAFKPMVDAIVRLRESFANTSGGALVERHLLELEEEVQQLRREIRRLTEAEAFHRELLSAPTDPESTVVSPPLPSDPRDGRPVPQNQS